MLSVAGHTRCMRYYTLKEEGLFSTRRMKILEFAACVEFLQYHLIAAFVNSNRTPYVCIYV